MEQRALIPSSLHAHSHVHSHHLKSSQTTKATHTTHTAHAAHATHSHCHSLIKSLFGLHQHVVLGEANSQ